MPTPAPLPTRQMRVAMLWNGAVYDEMLLQEPTDVVVGEGEGAAFPLPEGAIDAPQLTFLRKNGVGYELNRPERASGYVWLNGQPTPVEHLQGQTHLGPGDYGVVTLGTVALFFQQVQGVQGERPLRALRDGAMMACLGLSVFAHVAVLLFIFLVAAQEFARPDELELDSELVRKFMIYPPPTEEPEIKGSGTEVEDPGVRDREEAGGKKHERDEGKVGTETAQAKDTQLAGERTDAVADKVRGMGLLGVLSGGGQSNAIASALDTPSLDNMLAGLGSVKTIVGKGSGGTGLRGVGSGGGGKGKGALFGAGAIGTGVAGGKGSGLGRGKRGVGVKGRAAREVSLSLGSKRAKVNGFLSKEQINRVVRANQAAIKYCFELALQRQPNLKGAVNVQWRISLQGRVTSTRVTKTTLRNSKVEGCMARQIKRWKFPKPDGGEVVVTYPFLFRGG